MAKFFISKFMTKYLYSVTMHSKLIVFLHKLTKEKHNNKLIHHNHR